MMEITRFQAYWLCNVPLHLGAGGFNDNFRHHYLQTLHGYGLSYCVVHNNASGIEFMYLPVTSRFLHARQIQTLHGVLYIN